jgi:hypothetical protein
MNIDWSHCPEDYSYFCRFHHRFCVKPCIGCENCCEKRPALKATGVEPDWNGEGLPPANIECEVFDHEEKQYSRCKTLSAATMSGERACATIEPKGHFGRLIWGVNFRPIRTKEQQERESAITKARNACPYPGSESTKIDVEALYDAGMLRKEAE